MANLIGAIVGDRSEVTRTASEAIRAYAQTGSVKVELSLWKDGTYLFIARNRLTGLVIEEHRGQYPEEGQHR